MPDLTTIPAQVEAFALHLRDFEGKAAPTIKAYRGHVRRWLESGLTDAQWLAQQAGAPRSHNQRVAALKAWAKYSETELSARLPKRKIVKGQKFVLEPQDEALLLAQFDGWPLRERALMHLIYSAGLRNEEVRNLTLDGLRLDLRTVYLSGKGDGGEIGDHAHFDAATRDLLRGWLEHERPLIRGAADSPLVFLTRRESVTSGTGALAGEHLAGEQPTGEGASATVRLKQRGAHFGGKRLGEKWLVRLHRDGYLRAAAAARAAGDPDQAQRLELAAAQLHPVHLRRRDRCTHRLRSGENPEDTRVFMRHAALASTQEYFVHDPARTLAQFDAYDTPGAVQSPASKVQRPESGPPVELLPERKAG